MNILSLFNGMSVGRMALDELDIEVGTYYSSEIDKYAMKASNLLYPDTIQLGSVLDWKSWDIDWSSIDVVTGGPPCQAFSVAGKRLAFDDDRGKLTKTYFDVVKKCKPKLILMENVPGMLSVCGGEVFKYVLKEFNNCGYAVDFIQINSSLISAQNRSRVFLVGKPVSECRDLLYDAEVTKESLNDKEMLITMFKSTLSQPEDRGSMLCDILEDSWVVDREKSYCIDANYFKGGNLKSYFESSRRQLCFKSENDLIKGKNKDPSSIYRKLTPRECMRLQTIPERHIDTLIDSDISNTQLYKMTGNAWTMEVIKHLYKNLLNL